MNPYLTAGQAEGLLGIPRDRVRRWRERGKLLVRATQGGHEMYDPMDLIDLNDKADADPRSRLANA